MTLNVTGKHRYDYVYRPEGEENKTQIVERCQGYCGIQWCDGYGMLLILTTFTYIGLLYYQIIKPRYGRQIYDRSLRPVHTLLAGILSNRSIYYAIEHVINIVNCLNCVYFVQIMHYHCIGATACRPGDLPLLRHNVFQRKAEITVWHRNFIWYWICVFKTYRPCKCHRLRLDSNLRVDSIGKWYSHRLHNSYLFFNRLIGVQWFVVFLCNFCWAYFAFEWKWADWFLAVLAIKRHIFWIMQKKEVALCLAIYWFSRKVHLRLR